MSNYGIQMWDSSGNPTVDGLYSNYFMEAFFDSAQGAQTSQQHEINNPEQAPLVFIRPKYTGQWLGWFYSLAPESGNQANKLVWYNQMFWWHVPPPEYYSRVFRPFSVRGPIADAYGVEVTDAAGTLLFDTKSPLLTIKHIAWYPNGFSGEHVIWDPDENLGVLLHSIETDGAVPNTGEWIPPAYGYSIYRNAGNTVVRHGRADTTAPYGNAGPVLIVAAKMW